MPGGTDGSIGGGVGKASLFGPTAGIGGTSTGAYNPNSRKIGKGQKARPAPTGYTGWGGGYGIAPTTTTPNQGYGGGIAPNTGKLIANPMNTMAGSMWHPSGQSLMPATAKGSLTGNVPRSMEAINYVPPPPPGPPPRMAAAPVNHGAAPGRFSGPNAVEQARMPRPMPPPGLPSGPSVPPDMAGRDPNSPANAALRPYR